MYRVSSGKVQSCSHPLLCPRVVVHIESLSHAMPSCCAPKSQPNYPIIFSYNPFDLQDHCNQLPTEDSKALGAILAYLEESLQPPDLEDTFADQDSHLEHTPPLYSGICAFCGVSVRSFSEDDVGLLVFDLGKELG